ncbi:MAG: flagellar assembly protein FliH [Campylobacterales bacterium]|nr:flagellar assembly protein FliH [Campylobacterales bacterium]
METIISQESTSGHVINRYSFKVLSSSAQAFAESHSKDDDFIPAATAEKTQEKKKEVEKLSQEKEEISGETLSKSSKDALIESLLQKTDEMSSNFIKMQMKLESKEDEFKQALEKAKAEAFQEGKEAGAKEAAEAVQSEHTALTKQLLTSVETLDKSAKAFSTSIEGIKEELIHAALDIAKEVVLIETTEKGNEIASLLAKALISEIQGAAKVTIKVNPNGKAAIEKALESLENVTVLSDNAISNGGVVILSDAGNIDGNIMQRYARVKNAALGK